MQVPGCLAEEAGGRVHLKVRSAGTTLTQSRGPSVSFVLQPTPAYPAGRGSLWALARRACCLLPPLPGPPVPERSTPTHSFSRGSSGLLGYHAHFGRCKRKARAKRTNFPKAEVQFICLESLPRAPKSTPHQALLFLTSHGAASETGSFSSWAWGRQDHLLPSEHRLSGWRHTPRTPSPLVLLPTGVPGNRSASKRQAEAAPWEPISSTPTTMPRHTKG